MSKAPVKKAPEPTKAPKNTSQSMYAPKATKKTNSTFKMPTAVKLMSAAAQKLMISALLAETAWKNRRVSKDGKDVKDTKDTTK